MSNSIFNALNEKQTKLDEAKDLIFDKKKELELKRDGEIVAEVTSYFKGLETDLEDIHFSNSTSYMEISAKGEEYEREVWDEKKDDYVTIKKYSRNRLSTIYIEGNDWRGQEAGAARFTKIGLGSSSYSEHYDKATLDRFIFNGRMAMMLLDHQDDILGAINKIYDKTRAKFDKLNNELSGLRRDIDKIIQDRKNYKTDTLMRDLKQGVEFTSKDLPYLQIRYDFGYGGIKKMKIDKVSYSGKSCNLTIERVLRRWDDKTEEMVDYLHTYQEDRVRVSNIEDSVANTSIKWNVVTNNVLA
jgi:hypothetical protein|tara:strand:+ start:1054 stop:1953 length:900 start_codon:yes stop_codon:yes gene_type:complete